MSTIERGSYREDPGLRARLQAFSPDEPGVVYPFTARLAKERGWTRDHARRVTEEYLRFVYLAMTAGHPVTPSPAVDEAWHLHLTCTRSYWEEMCGRVLGRPLHHEPTRGGADEEAKFADQYARTLASYRAAFGHEPPADIWPRRAGEVPAPIPRGAVPRPAAAEPNPHLLAVVAAVLVGGVSAGLATVFGLPGGAAIFLGIVAAIMGYPFATMAAEHSRPRPGRRAARASGDCGAILTPVADFGGGDHHGGCGGHAGCGGHGGCGGSGCGSGCGGGGH